MNKRAEINLKTQSKLKNIPEIDDFLVSLKTEAFSNHTLINYQYDLVKFVDFLDSKQIYFKKVDSDTIELFAKTLHKNGLGFSSITRVLSTLSSFYRFLVNHKLIKINPVDLALKPKLKNKITKTLDVDQISALLDQKVETELDLRDNTIMELFYATGIRLSELVNLDLEDLDFENKLVLVYGKNKKQRLCPLSQISIKKLKKWLIVRKKWLESNSKKSIQANQSNALFLSKRLTRLTQRSVQIRLSKLANQFGLSEIHPHMFRHSVASHLLQDGANLRLIQEFLGHSDINTTQRYTHLDFQHMAKAYDKHHRLSKKE